MPAASGGPRNGITPESDSPLARPAVEERKSQNDNSGVPLDASQLPLVDSATNAPPAPSAAGQPSPEMYRTQGSSIPHSAAAKRRRLWSVALVSAAILILLAGAVLLYRGRQSATSPVHSLTRITFDEGLQSDPTWSPDGRYIAYTAVPDGATNVWMQQIGAGDPIQITPGPGPNSQPDWSPDGKYIAYRSDVGEGGLYVIPAIGGAGRESRIANFGYNPRWSPDGSQILFHTEPLPWKGISQLFVVGLDGSSPRKV